MGDYSAFTTVAGNVTFNSVASTNKQGHVFVVLIVHLCGFLPVVPLVHRTL